MVRRRDDSVFIFLFRVCNDAKQPRDNLVKNFNLSWLELCHLVEGTAELRGGTKNTNMKNRCEENIG